MKKLLLSTAVACSLTIAPLQAAKAEPITTTAIIVIGSKILAWWTAKTVVVAKVATAAKVAIPAATKAGLVEGSKGALIGTGRALALDATNAQAKQIIKSQVIRRGGRGAIESGMRAGIQTYRQLDQ